MHTEMQQLKQTVSGTTTVYAPQTSTVVDTSSDEIGAKDVPPATKPVANPTENAVQILEDTPAVDDGAATRKAALSATQSTFKENSLKSNDAFAQFNCALRHLGGLLVVVVVVVVVLVLVVERT